MLQQRWWSLTSCRLCMQRQHREQRTRRARLVSVIDSVGGGVEGDVGRVFL